MLSILILAAGQSSRMRGEDKLLQEVEGQPLIRLIARRAGQTGCPVLVTLPVASTERRRALSDLPVSLVEVQDADQGMAHSIRAGIAALPQQTEAVMILPADMPELTGADLCLMHDFWRDSENESILRGATDAGQPGHPVVFPASCFDALLALEGDRGAKPVLSENRHLIRDVILPDAHALTDLDTQEDWKAWRKRQ